MNMMRKKLLIGLALLLCLSTLLISCGSVKQMKFSKAIDKDAFQGNQKVHSSATKTDIDGALVDAVAPLALFTKLGDTGLATQTVFNVATGKTVLSVAAAEATIGEENKVTTQTVQLKEYQDTAWFYVTETTVTTKDGEPITSVSITLYKADGTTFAKAERANVEISELEEPSDACDLIFFDGVCYRITEEGAVDKAFDFSELRQIPDITDKRGDRYYMLDDEELRIYDGQLNLEVRYQAPSYAEDFCNSFILENGDVLVQYQTECNDQEEDYTYVDEGGTKQRLTSLLIDGKSGKQKDLELEYIVRMLISDLDEAEGLNKSIDNLAMIYFIEDRRIDTSDEAMTFVSLSNSMKIQGEMNGYVPGKVMTIEPVALDRWSVSNSDGQTFLLNEKGKVLGEITNGNIEQGVGIVLGNKIFDWNLELLCDLNQYNPINLWFFEGCVLFRTLDEEIKLYAGGEVRTLIAEGETKDLEMLPEVGFMIVNTEDASDFKIYNAKAEQIYASTVGTTTYMGGASTVMYTENEALVMIPLINTANPEASEIDTYFLIK